MHELSLVESIKAITLRHARMQRASRVVSVRIVIGDLSSYVEEALVTFWDEVSRATEASGARLEFLRISGELMCLHCSKSFTAKRSDYRCPSCGSEWVKPLAGEECYVDSIEVEVAQGAQVCR